MVVLEKIKSVWKVNGELAFTLFGVIFGLILGFVLRTFEVDRKTIIYINFPGEILMNILRLMILPLIVASIISSLSQLDADQSGAVSKWAFTYYAITTTCAVILGIILVLAIHPGNPSIKGKTLAEIEIEQAANISGMDKFFDVFRNIFPDNIITATFQHTSTQFVHLNLSDPLVWTLTTRKSIGINVLGLIFFCVAVGITLSNLREKGKAVADVFVALDHVVILLIRCTMWYAPIGICSLIASKIMEIGDLGKTIHQLGLYMGTVILGLTLHLFGTISVIYFIASRKNPHKFLKGLLQAAITAVGTASSAATIPVTYKCLEAEGIDPSYLKFVLPLGAMINMDGTALYEAVASIFIAQINGIDLSISQVITVSIIATFASIGAASIPSAGLVTMIIVLSAVGLPADDISTVIAVDWFLDRLRTCVNICGDAVGCAFVQALVEKKQETPALIRKISQWTNKTLIRSKPTVLPRIQEDPETSSV